MNRICYISSMCDPITYKKVFTKKEKPIPNASKYNRLMAEGFFQNGYEVNAVNIISTNKKYVKTFLKRLKKVDYNGVSHSYIPISNFKFLHHLLVALGVFFKVLFSKKNTVIIYDGLVIIGSLFACFAAKIRGFKKICIVTDLPKYVRTTEFENKMNSKVLNKADGFVFLTSEMNDVVNKKGKPYIVSEGHSDFIESTKDISTTKSTKKVVLYAGSISQKYGIESLCKVFENICETDVELHIFGDGDFKNQLEGYCEGHSNVKYFGVLENEKVIKAEKDATLLVNPRTPEGDYTRYSFPSKTIEYMSTGTPVLMFKLPGVPSEYDEYLFYFDGPSIPQMQSSIMRLLEKDPLELSSFGQKARNFVLSKKNNVEQAKKVLELIKLVK